MSKVVVEDGKLKFRRLIKTRELPVESLDWAYIQQMDGEASMCCGGMGYQIIRVIVFDKDGNDETFMFEKMDEAQDLLAQIKAANPDVATGYTAENKARFASYLKAVEV